MLNFLKKIYNRFYILKIASDIVTKSIDDKDCNFCSKYIEKKYCINYREAQLNEILNTMRRLGNKCTMCTIRKINQKYINLIAKYLEYKAKTK